MEIVGCKVCSKIERKEILLPKTQSMIKHLDWRKCTIGRLIIVVK